MMPLAQRKRGRRPIDPNDVSVYVGVTLPARQYDEFSRLALREDVSVLGDVAAHRVHGEIIRRQLQEKKTKNSSA